MAFLQGDGSIAIVRRTGNTGTRVFVVRPDGTGAREVGIGGDHSEGWAPAWSPDGRHLCCVVQKGRRSGLFAYSLVDQSQRRLTEALEADDDAPAWSPDGTLIAFAQGDGGSPDHLRMLDVTSGESWPLTSGIGLDGQPSWSPDGRWIVFHRALVEPAGLHVVPAAGGSAQFLTPGEMPDWGPDGSLVAYSHGGLLWAIRVCNGVEADGPPRQLTHDPRVEDHDPSWSPDGQHVVFSRRVVNGTDRPPRLIVLSLASGEEQDIGEGQEPDWGLDCPADGA